MTTITINRRNGDVYEFSAASRYVYLSINGGGRMQICRGGKFRGYTIQLSAQSDRAELADRVGAWMGAHCRHVRLGDFPVPNTMADLLA